MATPPAPSGLDRLLNTLFGLDPASGAAFGTGRATLEWAFMLPGWVWALVVLVGVPTQDGREAVLALALPSVVVCVVLAVHFRVAEQEMASILFFTTILSLPTIGAFIWLLGT